MTAGVILGTLAVVLIVVVVGLLLDRKVRLLPRRQDLEPARKKPPAYAAGEAPSTAIRARPAQLEKLRAQRCPACRSAMDVGEDDTVRFDDRDLLVLHFTCPSCAGKRSVYVTPVT